MSSALMIYDGVKLGTRSIYDQINGKEEIKLKTTSATSNKTANEMYCQENENK